MKAADDGELRTFERDVVCENCAMAPDPKQRIGLQEALGLILIVLLIFAIMVARYGRLVPWHAH